MTLALQLAERVAHAAYRPRPRLTVAEFADREVVVTAGPLSGLRWRTNFAPYQREILNACLTHEFVVVMGSAQWGKTACAVCVVAYHIAQEPSHCLIVEPTVDPMARDFSKNRLGPTIEASPALAARVGRPRSKDGGNTMTTKQFRGGSIAIAGANSAASLAARSVRVLVLDEVDRYPPELPGEGATIEVAIKRTLAFRGKRRVMMLSSPTLKGAPIHQWYQRGNQQKFFVPCPACGHRQALEWANVQWDGGEDGDPSTARLVCPSCQASFGDAERIASLAHGEWRPTVPGEPGIVSFHLWEAYSPLSSLSEIVSGFLHARKAAKAGDRSPMHTWQNTTLGEPVEPDEGEGVEPHVLLLRREPYGAGIEVPERASVLVMGVDVQDDRLEALVVGVGLGEETWLVDRLLFPGNTARAEPWDMLTEQLDVEYRHATGVRLAILATAVDSGGHRTTEVYDYCHRKAARRVYAVIGREGQRAIISSPSPRRWGRGERQVPLYTIGVDTAKALFVSRLMLTEHGPGYVHIPHAEWADEELAAQLTAERLVTRFTRGIPEAFWKRIRPRNEMLDAYVYALGALRLLNPKLELMAERVRAAAQLPPPPVLDTTGDPAEPVPPPVPTQPTTGRRTYRSSYMDRARLPTRDRR